MSKTTALCPLTHNQAVLATMNPQADTRPATQHNPAFAAPYGQTPEELMATKKARMAAALEVQKALHANLDGLITAVRNMTFEEASNWVILVGNIAIHMDDQNRTAPAAADGATQFPKNVAEHLAPRITNNGGDKGVAVPYPTALNQHLKDCAKALHEITEVISEMALDL